MTEPVNNWADDLLDRKQYADFLTTYIERKCVPGQSGIVLALDAPWGLGKSFFVKRWAADLRDAGRAVVTFDAWENDSAEAPVISFMGELRKSLAPLQEQAPKAEAIRREVQKKTKEVVSNLRRATVPALAVVGKAVLKKATGIGLDEVIDALQGEGNPEEALENLAASAPESLEKGLDAFFEKALEGHAERMEAVKAFRQSLEELLAVLHRADLAQGPLYVFIDELDRCRPDYALRLLEGIKHLFSVKGVAFVVSTNLPQLGSAVGAVYGPSFDGFRYLKRFFDFEYELPLPTHEQFIRVQVAGTVLEKPPGHTGLDPRLKNGRDAPAAFTHVAEAMRLDLRSLQRTLAIAEAAVTGAPPGAPFVAVWLFFLSALRHLYPDDFLKISSRAIDQKDFLEVLRRVMPGPTRVPSASLTERGGFTPAETNLPAILYEIFGVSNSTSDKVREQIENEDPREISYPSVIRHVIGRLWTEGGGPHPLNDHAKLIAAAGHVKRD